MRIFAWVAALGNSLANSTLGNAFITKRDGGDSRMIAAAAAKEADGWVYGEVKDVDAKTHPCMVPYDQLPPEQKRKDEIFGGVVRAILQLPPAGYQLIAIVENPHEGEEEVAEAGEAHPA